MEKLYYQKHSSSKGWFFEVYNQILFFFINYFIIPLSIFCNPNIIFVKIVLPDPLGPRITVIPLEEKLKERFSNIFLFLFFKKYFINSNYIFFISHKNILKKSH